jgi:hypothetical protein
MPWLSTIEVPVNREAGVDYKAKRDYQREFIVLMDALTDGSIQVSVAPGIPRLFDLFIDTDGTRDLGARCYDVRAKQDADDPYRWHVTAKYTSGDRSRYSKFSPERGDERGSDANPLQRPPIVIWGQQKVQRVLEFDMSQQAVGQNGQPVLNSAGDPFDPPVVVEDTYPTLTYIRNEGTFDPGVPIAYKDAINNDVFLGAPQYCSKVDGITARSNVENNLQYFEVTYQFSFRRWNPPVEKGWLSQILDRGFYEIDANGNKKRIKDGFAQDIVTPFPLDGKGGKLVGTGALIGNGPGRQFQASDYKYLTFIPYQVLNFGDLAIV